MHVVGLKLVPQSTLDKSRYLNISFEIQISSRSEIDLDKIDKYKLQICPFL